MEKGLYDKVAVHGPQGNNGRLVKHYACSNCMEFFAELSVAFMWKEDAHREYNKWYPFNRAQLQALDSHSYEVLERCWNKYENTIPKK